MLSPKRNTGQALTITVGKRKITIDHSDLGKFQLSLKPVLALSGPDKLIAVEEMVLDAALGAGFVFSNDEIQKIAEAVILAVFAS